MYTKKYIVPSTEAFGPKYNKDRLKVVVKGSSLAPVLCRSGVSQNGHGCVTFCCRELVCAHKSTCGVQVSQLFTNISRSATC